MKKQTFETLLYSTIGVVAMVPILVGVNIIAGALGTRIDLTQEKAYTLSQGTRNILAKLDTPVQVRFYCSQETTEEALQLRNYAKDVEALLEEYRQAAKGKLVIKKLNPKRFSDAAISARMDEIEPHMLPGGRPFYLGVSISVLDQKQAVILDPNRERLLEYDLTRAISRVVTPEKPVIGVMSPLPVFGAPSPPPMMMQMGQRGQQPWMLIGELQNDYDVRSVPMDSDKIDEAIKVLVVIHPREITDKAQYAIDQFVLRGGKLLAFLDPTPGFIDASKQNPMLGAMPNPGSSLDKLLKAWGLTFDTAKVVADVEFKMQIPGNNGEAQDAPTILSLSREGISSDDVVTSQLEELWLPYAGAFVGTPVDGLKETVLLTSTTNSQLVEGGMMATMASDSVMKNFKPSGAKYALAVKLSGKFKTAFPDGKPDEKKDAPASEDKTNAMPAATSAADSLKGSKQETTVILVGDADLLSDQVALRQVRTLFGSALVANNDNFTFMQNAVDQLTGDNNLIAVRSRATINRPFTKIKDLQAAANEKYQSDLAKAEQTANEIEQRLNQLQEGKKGQDQRYVLSPEEEAQIRKLNEEAAKTEEKKYEVLKDLNQEVDSLKLKVECVNILAVPLAVAASGILIATIKRRKTSAK